MNVIKSNGQKIVFAIVVIGCAIFSYTNMSGGEPEWLSQVSDNQRKIKEAISAGKVTDNYAFSASQVTRTLRYEEKLKANLDRVGKPLDRVPQYISYQTPSRPFVDPSTETHVPVVEETAVLGQLDNIEAKGDHGGVFLTWNVPKKLEYIEPVRLEIFRSEGTAKIDMTKPPYNVIQYGLEEPVVEQAPAAVPATAAKPPADAPAEEDAPKALTSGEKRRAARAAAEETTRGGDSGRGEAPKEEANAAESLPPEYASVQVFCDTHVEPKTTYTYQLRLVGRMTVTPEQRIETKVNGEVTKITVIHAPAGVQTIPPANPGSTVTLLAAPPTKPVSAVPPANFEFRLAGTIGNLSPAGTPESKVSTDYKASFRVRVWVADAQEWKDVTMQIGPTEKLKGAIPYKPKGSTTPKAYEFDSGFSLVEVKWGEIVREATVEVPQKDEKGNPIVDPVTHRAVKVKQVVKNTVPNEVAVLQDAKGRQAEYPKTADFGTRDESIKYLRLRWKEEEELQKKNAERMKVVIAKNKVAEEKRKAEAKAKAEAEAKANNISIGVGSNGGGAGGGGRGGGGGDGGFGGGNGGGRGGGGRGR